MIEVRDLKKSFGDPSIEILHGLTFTIQDSQFVSITGRSGSGKSTLLYAMSTLDFPTSGQVFYSGQEVQKMTELEIENFRNLKMGFIFQFHYLLPELTALDNVLMPARRTEQHVKRRERALNLLSQFGLDKKTNSLPKELSGGEQQRVAIARALIMEPQYIFADEPTGNLDSVNGDTVMRILKDITRQSSTSVIYVTHDPDFAELADQKIVLVDGHLEKKG